MSINRGMDREDVVYIYNGIFLSHRNEIGSSYRDMDRPRDCSTEYSKSKIEKQISYINAYMWSLKKWYRWSYLQNRNRDRDIKNKYMDTKVGKGRWDELGDWKWHTYAIDTMYKISSENLLHGTGNSTQCSSVIQMGKKSKEEGISVETNTKL